MEKVRRMKLSWKITGVVLCMAMLVGGLVGGISLMQMRQYLLDSSKQRTISVARVAADMVDGDMLENLQAGDEGTREYKEIFDTLSHFLLDEDVAYIYTMRRVEGEVQFVVDTDTEEGGAIGEPYESYEELDAALEGEVIGDSEVTTDEWGSFYTGYAPIYNTKQQVVGVVGVDCTVGSIQERVMGMCKSLVLIVCLCLLVAAVLAAFLGHFMARDVLTIHDKMNQLASNDGDLTQMITVRSGDELENVAVSFNVFLEKLRKIMISVRENEMRLEKSTNQIQGEVVTATQELANMTTTLNDMSASMLDTSHSVSEITTATGDVKHMVENLYSQSKQSEEYARGVSAHAQEAKHTCQDSKSKMQQDIDNIARDIEDKISATKRIAEIVGLTNDIINISDQTQLLALNASIEAARAGDEGKGFAVVAGEIGKLAEATATTAKVIEEINQFTVETVSALVESSKEMVSLVIRRVNGDYENMVAVGDAYAKDSQMFSDEMARFRRMANQLSEDMLRIEDNIHRIMAVVEEETASITVVGETAGEIHAKMQTVRTGTDVNGEIVQELGDILERFTL